MEPCAYQSDLKLMYLCLGHTLNSEHRLPKNVWHMCRKVKKVILTDNSHSKWKIITAYVFCNEEVTAGQEALLCKDAIGGNISSTTLEFQGSSREPVTFALDMVWQCLFCSTIADPVAESSRIEEFNVPVPFESVDIRKLV